MAVGDYVVTAACVVARDGTPYGESYYYRHAILPAGVPAAEKERLAAAGLVSLVVAEEVVVAPVVAAVTEVKSTARRRRSDGDPSVVDAD